MTFCRNAIQIVGFMYLKVRDDQCIVGPGLRASTYWKGFLCLYSSHPESRPCNTASVTIFPRDTQYAVERRTNLIVFAAVYAVLTAVTPGGVTSVQTVPRTRLSILFLRRSYCSYPRRSNLGTNSAANTVTYTQKSIHRLSPLRRIR